MEQHVRQTRKDRTLGVAGCGRMGAPMLAALRGAGFDAAGFDLRAGLGPDISTDLAGFATGLEILISVVRDSNETDALLFDQQALVSRAPLRTVIICSTLSPRYVTDLRKRLPTHITLIDAPMSGAQIKAMDGTLTFMLGGDDATIAPHMPLFKAMGETVHIMGGLGAGMSAKVLNNLLAASHTAMTRLVLDWADAQGIDEQRLLTLIDSASGQNWLASGFEQIEFARDGYADDNSIGILIKDVAAALDSAPAGAATDLPNAVQASLRTLITRPKP